MSKLDQEEKDILEAFESGRLKPVKNRRHEISRHRKVAEATFAKDSRINIRISSKDGHCASAPWLKECRIKHWSRASCTNMSKVKLPSILLRGKWGLDRSATPSLASKFVLSHPLTFSFRLQVCILRCL
jgi:hypothetical protein